MTFRLSILFFLYFFTSIHLRAVSELPPLLALAVTVNSNDTIVLSTNTIGNILLPEIGTTGSEKQYLGTVEFNSTQNNGSTDYRLVLTQLEQPIVESPPSSGWYAQLINPTAFDSNQWVALKIYTNVSTTSKPNDPIYITGTEVAHTSTGANLTAVADADYANFIGVLSLYAIDDGGNSMTTGTYQGVFQIKFSPLL